MPDLHFIASEELHDRICKEAAKTGDTMAGAIRNLIADGLRFRKFLGSLLKWIPNDENRKGSPPVPDGGEKGSK